MSITDRGQLAAIMALHVQDPDDRRAAADALYALGWRPPARVITDPDDLDALPDGSVVLRDHKAWERDIGVWWHGGITTGYARPYGFGAITVLHTPENGDTND